MRPHRARSEEAAAEPADHNNATATADEEVAVANDVPTEAVRNSDDPMDDDDDGDENMWAGL